MAANDITISQSLRYSKNQSTASQTTSFSFAQSGDKYQAGIQIVGTAEESLDKGDIGTISYLSFKNLDGTNFVSIGKTTGVYTIKCLPGAGGLIPWNSSVAPLVKADTASVELDYLMIEA